MHHQPKFRQCLAVAVVAMLSGMMAAQSAVGAEPSAAAKDMARSSATAAAGLQKLVEQASSQREKMIADHESLAKQMKDATDEQRKTILEKMHEQQKNFEAAQSALHKQIRDEQRRQRQNAAPGKR